MDRKIDFLIIGAQKAGTTSLYDHLAGHEDLFLPIRKDLPFFVDAGSGEVRERDFGYHYRPCNGAALLGGSFVHLLYHPESPVRIGAYNPGMRLIAMLRNPVDRAYSAYWFARREGYEAKASFEEALALEDERATGSMRERNELTYLGHGRYHEQLARYLERFDRSALYLCLFEDFVAAPEAVVSDILAWLGVDPSGSRRPAPGRKNASGMPRSRVLQRTLIVPPQWASTMYRAVVPRRIRYGLDRAVVAPLRALNTKPFRYPPMASETRARLIEYFAPHNERLGRLTGLDLGLWA